MITFGVLTATIGSNTEQTQLENHTYHAPRDTRNGLSSIQLPLITTKSASNINITVSACNYSKTRNNKTTINVFLVRYPRLRRA